MTSPLHGIRVVLFDIDGTLVKAGGAGRGAMVRTFDELFGIGHALDGYSFVGATDRAVLRDVFTAALSRLPTAQEGVAFHDRYVANLRETLAASTSYQVLPHAHECLDALSDRGLVLGLATGNFEASAMLKLAPGGLDGYFGFGGFGEDGPSRDGLVARAIERARRHTERSLSPHEVAVVGDSTKDVSSALANAAVSIAVTTGWQSRDELRGAGPHHLLEGLDELLG